MVGAEQHQVVHVTHVAFYPECVLDELVEWIEVIVSQHLAGQAANGNTVGGPAKGQALVRRDAGQQLP